MERRKTACVLDGTKIRDQDLAKPKDEIERLATEDIRPRSRGGSRRRNPAFHLYVNSMIAIYN